MAILRPEGREEGDAEEGLDEMSGACPHCGSIIETPDGYAGRYTAAAEDGSRGSGGIYTTVCLGCGAELEAYEPRDAGEAPTWPPLFKPPQNT